MDTMTLKENLPTFVEFIEKRRRTKKNQLPKHLRPLPKWPILVQIALNLAIIIGVISLIVNKDDFLTEAAPAAGLVVVFLFTIYTLISAMQIRSRYEKTKLHKLTTLNLWLMGIAFFTWAIGIVTFMP